MPTVSIIIPNYNHAPFLVQRLDSVFQQTFQDFEVILLDDASIDNSLEILSAYATKYPDKVAHFIVNEKNSGSPFRQWKKGIDLAKGEYIWIAESDDWAEMAFLERLMGIIEKDEAGRKLNMIFSDSYRVLGERFQRNTKEDFNISKAFKIDSNTFDVLLKRNPVPNASAVLFKKAVVVYSDTKDIEHFSLCGDWLFWGRLLQKGSNYYLGEPLNYFRKHEGSVTSINTSNGALVKERKKVRRKLILSSKIPLEKKLRFFLNTLFK